MGAEIARATDGTICLGMRCWTIRWVSSASPGNSGAPRHPSPFDLEYKIRTKHKMDVNEHGSIDVTLLKYITINKPAHNSHRTRALTHADAPGRGPGYTSTYHYPGSRVNTTQFHNKNDSIIRQYYYIVHVGLLMKRNLQQVAD